MTFTGVQQGTEEGWETYNSQIPPTNISFKVGGLKPARNFQFRITGVNEVGDSDPSDPKPIPPITMPEQGKNIFNTSCYIPYTFCIFKAMLLLVGYHHRLMARS